MEWYVYILECSDKTLYTGATNDVIKRVKKHINGTGAKYTRGRGPMTLMWSYGVSSKSDALKLEYKIKKLTKSRKLDLINGELILS